MALGVRRISAALLFAGAAMALDPQSNPANGGVPIVQPGAPGQPGKIVSPSVAAAPPRILTEADISFMQGMIHHHSQAVEMVDLLRTRTRNKKLLAFANRISISQTDEIRFMQKWLTDRGKPAPMMMAGGMDHSKMDHSKMS